MREAKEWLDASSLHDRYLHVQSKCNHPWRPHASSSSVSSFALDRRDVHNNSAATSFAHAPYMQHAVKTNAYVQCIEINILKGDIHTYIHTYQHKTRCEAGLAASR